MGPVHSEIIIMKAFIFATVLAVAAAAFAAAEAGEHIALRPAAVASAYLNDDADVAEAKAAFQAVFDKYAAGEVALPVAPVAPAAAVIAAPYWHGAYPYAHAAYPAYAGYAGYAGYYGYPYGYYGKAGACVNAANIPVPCA